MCRKLKVLSVVVNRTCNLSCKHCYFRTSSEGHSLANGEWLRFFSSLFAGVSPEVVSFAGREIFALPSSASLLFDVIRTRDSIQEHSEKRTEIGVITNGTLLDGYRDSLLHSPPDYFDISVEGKPETHDFVRGEGSFDRLRPNLFWLTEKFTGRVWLTPTLNRKNLYRLGDIVHFYNDRFGLNRYSFGFFVPNTGTDRSLVLKAGDYRHFVGSILPGLQKLPAFAAPVKMIFELDGNQRFLIDLLEKRGYLSGGQPLESEKIAFSNGIELVFNVARIPVGLWRSVRVSPEGYWIAAEDLLRVEEYEELAVTSLRTNDFDAVLLYNTGLDSRRYVELMNGPARRFAAQKVKVAS
jgi:hypothetical protein